MAGVVLLLSLFLQPLSAGDLPFNGEKIYFDIKYKYGLVMLKAGSAEYQINRTRYEGIPAYKTDLNFKTGSFFDKIFKIRDTLYSYVDSDIKPLYYVRILNEGSTHYREEIRFNSFGSDYSEVKSMRKSEGEVKFDTLLVSNTHGFDFLSIFSYIRTIDLSTIPLESTRNIAMFAGRKRINIVMRFRGQSILEKSDYLKYRTYKLELDIADEVFNESKNSIEAWFSDDQNRIPLKIKAKLKIGAAEIDYKSHKGLKYPFLSEVRINPQAR